MHLSQMKKNKILLLQFHLNIKNPYYYFIPSVIDQSYAYSPFIVFVL